MRNPRRGSSSDSSARLLWAVASLLVIFQTVHSLILTNFQRRTSTSFQTRRLLSSVSSKCRSNTGISGMQMKDASASYWFNVGDNVQVSSSVKKAGIELKGRRGKVTETWEKCEVDPTCCCAEFVDDNFAVTVKFEGKLDPATIGQEDFIQGIGTTFTHYFNEDELIKVEDVASLTPPVAFDGMSCKAFKLDQLKKGKQAQRIASFEASRSKEDD